MSSAPPVFALAAGLQSYDWGKLGKESKAAQYALSAALPDFELVEDKPYAELWMGTHPTLPSKVHGTSETLAAHLATNKSYIGDSVSERFQVKDGNLPFLFKILAIRKALSIQAHPDKKFAEKLHAERPDLYKGTPPLYDNHKPEMAIALTPFKALCGFRPLPEISNFLTTVPELGALIPPTIIAKFTTVAASPNPNGPAEKAALREVFSALMTVEPEQVKGQLSLLIARYKAGAVTPQEVPLRDLAIAIESDFPNDIGVFCPFVLNVIDLEPGQAIFLGAGEPHAYISGDIVETMATSDNVLRAGLTPKVRDVPNLITSLTYESGPGLNHCVRPSQFSDNTLLYDPPIPEFSVLEVNVPKDGAEKHKALDGPSLAIVTEGEGSVHWDNEELGLKEGSVIFIAAGQEVDLKATCGGLTVYRAFVEAK
ncbi:mannose-6-phosphate isomerase [Sistotremastrum niveocremeum HHB9708]|uniref:Mannose-6-phosphate isomerase n=2 Tax=Sistotremastraceae TaxID=3402574 RepID=A0A164VD74_9AGAM|nr:mannose-6-phosphate isomerase [Sistotremastrum niveocremeum HHB9708]KZT33854.1 mannose-6-phosphate isomerase [Sistotremastrum suecicum HHB10207 ss-3]